MFVHLTFAHYLPGQVYIKLLKNVKLVESSEFSNESKPALHYPDSDSESRNLKEQDKNLCIEPSRQLMDQCDSTTVGSPRRQLDSLLAGNPPQMACQVENFGAFCPLVSMRSSSLQRALPIYLAFAFTSSNQSTFHWAMLQASAMSSHSKALTSSDGSAAASSASAAYHADVSTVGKYALAVGTVLHPIEVPLLISVHVSFVILILVSDTSGMSATSGTNKRPKRSLMDTYHK